MADLKERIARRCAKEFSDGDFINLGIGLPTKVADYLPKNMEITCHSENGFAGIGENANSKNLDVDIINAGGTYVTTVARVKYFDITEAFGLIRGGHVSNTVLGAMQVAQNGDLANWIVPGSKVAGMGGAMDLCEGCPKVIIVMLHTQREQHKILKKCTLPITAKKCVNTIITEMAVMDVTNEGIVARELHPDYTKEDVEKATGCKIIWSPTLKAYDTA